MVTLGTEKRIRIRCGTKQLLRILVLRMQNHLIRWTMFNNIAVVHHHNFIRKVTGSRQIMSDVQHGKLFFLLDTGQQVQHT